MVNLYLTADNIGTQTGGGAVTFHESKSLKELGSCEVWDRKGLEGKPPMPKDEPWRWDAAALCRLWELDPDLSIGLVHGYAGTFSDSIRHLKLRKGIKVCWTVAAHDLEESIKEHEKVYGSYPFHHMSDPVQFARYKQGYLDADVVVCPSQYSADIMRRYGRTGRIEVIPHGCDLPEKVAPLPERFTVGMLGQYGPDKGAIYLLEAWKKLAYKDAILLLAGRDTAKPEVQAWCRQHGGGNIWFAGWMNDVSDFYNAISVLAVPSVSEAFNIEVLEAMVYGRPVICSRGAGAFELTEVPGIEPRDVEGLAKRIHEMYEVHTGAKKYIPCRKDGSQQIDEDFPNGLIDLVAIGNYNRTLAEKYTWDKIRLRYQSLWRELLA